MQDEIYKMQTIHTDIFKVIAKILRQVNQDKPIKLSFSSLANKNALGFLLSGLKANFKAQELNLNECQLDDQDLDRIAARLLEDNGIRYLLLSKNQFSTAAPLATVFKVKAN